MRTERLRPLQPILRAFAALLHRWLGFVLFCLQKRDELPNHQALNFYEHELKRAIFARAFATAPKINFRAQATSGHFHRTQRDNWFNVITRGLLPKIHAAPAPRAWHASQMCARTSIATSKSCSHASHAA